MMIEIADPIHVKVTAKSYAFIESATIQALQVYSVLIYTYIYESFGRLTPWARMDYTCKTYTVSMKFMWDSILCIKGGVITQFWISLFLMTQYAVVT